MRRLTAFALAVLPIAAILSLTATPGVAKLPGANGRVAFAKFDAATGNGNTQIYTSNPNGSDQKLLLAADSCCAAWSPDGRRIAVGHSTTDGRITTAVVNPDGSGLDVKTIPDPTLNLECSAWAPDGSRLLCTGWDDIDNSRPRGLFTIRASDWGDLRQLTTNPNGAQGVNDDPGDYSPDGTRVVFLREWPGTDRGILFVTGIDGGASKEITPGLHADCCSASWSSNGRWILYTDLGTLEVVHPDGSHRHPITLRASCPHRSGAAVLAGLRVFELRCRRGRPAMSPSLLYWVAFDPAWSPDGKRFVFSLFVKTSAVAGKRAVYTAAPDGSALRPVTKPVAVKDRALDFPGSTDWGAQPPP